MLFISKKYLMFAKELTDNKYIDVEICGFLLTNSEIKEMKINEVVQENELLLYIDNIGEKINNREACINTRYMPYMWHTHFDKAYPSVEDIISPIKNLTDVSIVFSKWGIWNIQHVGIMENPNLDSLYNVIDYYLNNLYEKSERGRGEYNESIKNIIQYTIAKIIEKLKKYFPKLFLSFTSWDDIQDNYYFIIND